MHAEEEIDVGWGVYLYFLIVLKLLQQLLPHHVESHDKCLERWRSRMGTILFYNANYYGTS